LVRQPLATIQPCARGVTVANRLVTFVAVVVVVVVVVVRHRRGSSPSFIVAVVAVTVPSSPS
jgi:hypothetical protein